VPYNRFTYDDLTAQLNVLSHLANSLYTIEAPAPAAKKAIALFSGRIRQEIDRVNRNRKKVRHNAPDFVQSEPSAFAETHLTLAEQVFQEEQIHG